MTRWFYLALLFTVGGFASAGYVYHSRYDDLPAQVPIHWDIHGQADGFVAKTDVLPVFLLMPAVMAGLLLLTLALPWLSPRHFEIDTFRGTYGYVMMLAVAVCGFIQAVMLWGSLTPLLPVDRLLVGGLCLFFLLIGLVLGKVRRNFWMGVRTPWTLANEEVWDATHRLAGQLFVAAGLAGMLIAAVPIAPVWLAFAGIMAAALGPVVYSLVVYKRMERQGRV